LLDFAATTATSHRRASTRLMNLHTSQKSVSKEYLSVDPLDVQNGHGSRGSHLTMNMFCWACEIVKFNRIAAFLSIANEPTWSNIQIYVQRDVEE